LGTQRAVILVGVNVIAKVRKVRLADLIGIEVEGFQHDVRNIAIEDRCCGLAKDSASACRELDLKTHLHTFT